MEKELVFERAGMKVVFTDTELRCMAIKLEMLSRMWPDEPQAEAYADMAETLRLMAKIAETQHLTAGN